MLIRYERAALALILLIGLAVRLYLLPTAGFALDLEQLHNWGLCALEKGTGLYQCSTPVTHPPVNPVFYGLEMGVLNLLNMDIRTFEGNGWVIAALKAHLVAFELAIAFLVYFIVRGRTGAAWALGAMAALYLNPGWLVVTAWWGQNDATYSFFILLSVYLLAQKRTRWAWIVYALAWLAKFQSVMFAPLFLIISLRRAGFRETIVGGIAFVLVFAAGLFPFLLGSGRDALTPFVGTVNLFPYITNGTFNMWYWVSGSSPTVLMDNLPLIGSVTYSQAGYILLAVATLALCLRAWLHDDDLFLLFATANLLFFMLPTQIQPRYLYPGLMLLAVAMARRPLLIAIYAGLSITFTYNIFSVVWLGVGLLYYPYRLMVWNSTHNAIAVTVLFAVLLWFVFGRRTKGLA
jgi:hypothetical protein